jgi:hypothetical protein
VPLPSSTAPGASVSGICDVLLCVWCVCFGFWVFGKGFWGGGVNTTTTHTTLPAVRWGVGQKTGVFLCVWRVGVGGVGKRYVPVVVRADDDDLAGQRGAVLEADDVPCRVRSDRKGLELGRQPRAAELVRDEVARQRILLRVRVARVDRVLRAVEGEGQRTRELLQEEIKPLAAHRVHDGRLGALLLALL